MINERQRLEEAQQAASELRQSLQRRIWELEMALRDKVQLLEDTVKAYHSTAEDLKVIPQTARNSRGEDLSIQIDIGAKKREGLLKTDIRRGVLPVLQDIRQELTDRTLGLRSELLAEQDVSEEVNNKRNELLEAKETLEGKLKRAEAAYKREKELLDQAAELHGVELDAMESRLLQLRDTSSEETQITSANRRVAEITALRSARRSEHVRKKATMAESITEVVAQCAEHREQVQHTLRHLKQQYASRLEAFLTTDNTNNFPAQKNYSAISSQLLSSSSPGDVRSHLRVSSAPSSSQLPIQPTVSPPEKENIYNISSNNRIPMRSIEYDDVSSYKSNNVSLLNDSYDKDIISVTTSNDPRRAIDFRMYKNHGSASSVADCDQSTSQYV